jgi:hypothetical protein
LSPVEHSRKLHALDSVLDTEAQEQAVEMGFYRTLGDIQILRNFGVVAPLEEKIDNLLLPVSQSADLLVHYYTSRVAQRTLPVRWAALRVRCAPMEFLVLRLSLHPRSQIYGKLLSKCENR